MASRRKVNNPVVEYNRIYLIAFAGQSASKHHVTQRKQVGVDKYGHPKYSRTVGKLQFSGNRTFGEQAVGTLEFNNDMYQDWFSKYEGFIDGFETAEAAAINLTKNVNEIYFGCPLCEFRTKDISSYKEHVNKHMNAIIQSVDVYSESQKEDE